MEEKEDKKVETPKITEKVKQKVEEVINRIIESNTVQGNIDLLYKLVDIHKDMSNEEYWKNKEEVMEMRYRAGNYGEYNEGGSYGRRGVRGTGPYSRYREYGRRGVPGTGRGRYRGEEALDEMYMNYGEYSEASQSYNEGNYGAEGGMKESAEGIMENIYEIVEELKDTGSPEVMQVIKKYSKKISEM